MSMTRSFELRQCVRDDIAEIKKVGFERVEAEEI
jgi:hypothetical protein